VTRPAGLAWQVPVASIGARRVGVGLPLSWAPAWSESHSGPLCTSRFCWSDPVPIPTDVLTRQSASPVHWSGKGRVTGWAPDDQEDSAGRWRPSAPALSRRVRSVDEPAARSSALGSWGASRL